MSEKFVKLVGNCSRCGEAVEIILSKKEVKQLWKRFKLPCAEANMDFDKEKLRELNRKKRK